MDMTVQEQKLLKLFHPYAFSQIQKAIQSNMRFVHYTTAETGIRIIQGGTVWMRKASTMNDFMEIQHGLNCLNSAYGSNHDMFVEIFDSIFPNFSEKLEDLFRAWRPDFQNNTFMACVSEHSPDGSISEDNLGRLSMWRAYGGKCGVAIVMNGQSFFRPTDALGAYSSPVAYLSVDDFNLQFNSLLLNLKAESDWMAELGEEVVFNNIFDAFRTAALCSKHPGFYEEREWRVIHSPNYNKSDVLKQSIEIIGGVPQAVIKIPLKNRPEQGLYGIEIPEFINRVIIGPTQYPLEVHEAFVHELESAGVLDANTKVVASLIPLRQ